jgi:hypothetical protein
MSAHPITLRSDLVALVDPTLLPDDLVEALSAAQAIVIATAHVRAATVHLDEAHRLLSIERHGAAPLAPAVDDLAAARRRRRIRVQGALVGAACMVPAVLTLPPVIAL